MGLIQCIMAWITPTPISFFFWLMCRCNYFSEFTSQPLLCTRSLSLSKGFQLAGLEVNYEDYHIWIRKQYWFSVTISDFFHIMAWNQGWPDDDIVIDMIFMNKSFYFRQKFLMKNSGSTAFTLTWPLNIFEIITSDMPYQTKGLAGIWPRFCSLHYKCITHNY